MTQVTQQQIAAALGALGVRTGDLLLVHSSLKSFGHVVGGATAVAQAIVDAISPGGSAFVPTFNYGRDVFDPATAPSYDGAVTEAFRMLPGAVRSLHPTHPLAGIGPDAGESLQGHENAHPFGQNSPLWKLWERDAWVALLGVDHRASSMIHVAEESLDLPYLNRTRMARVLGNGKIEQVTVRRPGCDFAFNRIDPILRKRGGIFEKRVGNCRLALMRASAIVEAASVLLRENPAALLCDLPDDGVCKQAREMIKQMAATEITRPQRRKLESEISNLKSGI